MPQQIQLLNDKKQSKDIIHYFTKRSVELQRDIISLRKEIFPNGSLWISWPKKVAKIETDITEDVIRNMALVNVWLM